MRMVLNHTQMRTQQRKDTEHKPNREKIPWLAISLQNYFVRSVEVQHRVAVVFVLRRFNPLAVVQYKVALIVFS